jgi:hypothetical protein
MKAKSEFLETEEPLTYSIPFAGSLVGIGKNASYAAARRGEIPTIRFGKKLRVPRAKFLRMFSGEPAEAVRAPTLEADTPAAVDLPSQQRKRSEKS